MNILCTTPLKSLELDEICILPKDEETRDSESLGKWVRSNGYLLTSLGLCHIPECNFATKTHIYCYSRY